MLQTNTLATAAGCYNSGANRKIAIVDGFGGLIQYDSIKPDGTPRKLLDVSCLNNLGWYTKTSLLEGIKLTYKAFLTPSGNDSM